MNRNQYCKIVTAAVLVALATGDARAAQCGNSAAGFEGWRQAFAGEARAKGVGASDQFLVKRGAAAIVSRGRALKQTHAALFASIEQRYGVPPGPLLAIWGMETAFGSQRGNQNMLSAVATLAYDCRRSEYFTDQLYAALTLIERGVLSAGTRGSMHGEYGQTQFMPKSILAYGTGNLDSPSGALNATANFLKAHGWRAGAGYQPGQPNFAAIQGWNAASVYQQAIALMGGQIDGGGTAQR
jgi:membrane-bound lytic murein transglycosylase B